MIGFGQLHFLEDLQTTNLYGRFTTFDLNSSSITSQIIIDSSGYYIDADGKSTYDPINKIIYVISDSEITSIDVTNGSTNVVYNGSVGCKFVEYEFNSILGCTDSLASNYDPIATIDDGSCIPYIYACDTASYYVGEWMMQGYWQYTTSSGTFYRGSDSNGTSLYIDITINYSTSNTTTVSVCDTYTWAVDGNTYTTSGTYTDVSTNAAGCDSVETLHLTITNSEMNNLTVTECDSYTWGVNGNTYTTSGTYTVINGCVTEELDLTINNSTSSTDTHVACDEFMWNCDGNTYTSSNNTATYTYTNAVGCDSVVTLDLTINQSTSSIDTHVSCDEFMWNCDGNLYTSSNNTATYVYTNAAGCDSTVTLDLTINQSTSL